MTSNRSCHSPLPVLDKQTQSSCVAHILAPPAPRPPPPVLRAFLTWGSSATVSCVLRAWTPCPCHPLLCLERQDSSTSHHVLGASEWRALSNLGLLLQMCSARLSAQTPPWRDACSLWMEDCPGSHGLGCLPGLWSRLKASSCDCAQEGRPQCGPLPRAVLATPGLPIFPWNLALCSCSFSRIRCLMTSVLPCWGLNLGLVC